MARHTISIILAAIILTLSVAGFAQTADKGDAVLNLIPADSIFCIRINNLNQATGNLDQYLMGVSPMPVSTGGLIKGQLGIMFGNYDLKGFDVNGSFAAFVIAESNDKSPDVYVLLPVTDYALLTDPNSHVSPPDSNGISAVGMGAAAQFFIKKVDSFAIMSHDYRKLSDMASMVSGGKSAALASVLNAAQIKQASTEPVWAYANMVKISSVYKTDISDGLEEMRKHIADPAMGIQSQIDNLEKTRQQVIAKDPNSPMISSFDAQIESLKKQKEEAQKTPAFMGGLANAFAGYAKDFMQQSKSITLSCNPKPAVLNFKMGLDALPGTEMAGMLVADGAAKNNPLIGYTEDGEAMNYVARINHPACKKLYAKCVDLAVIMAGKDANDPNVVKIKKLCDDSIDSIGDFIVCSFRVDPNARPMFDAKYVIEVKDVNLFNKAVDEAVQFWTGGTINDFYKSFGIETGFTVKRGAESYKGVSIDVVKLSMKYTDANSPQGKVLDAMYGGGFEYRWAIVNGLLVCRISSDPNALYQLIDEVKAGSPAQVCSEMQKAMSFIPDADSKDAIVTYNYLRLIKMMQGLTPMPFTMPDVPSRSNLVFAVKIDNGSLTIDFALPKEHLSEMMTAFQMMMQQQTQQPGQPAQGMPMQPAPQRTPGQPAPKMMPAQPMPAAPSGK